MICVAVAQILSALGRPESPIRRVHRTPELGSPSVHATLARTTLVHARCTRRGNAVQPRTSTGRSRVSRPPFSGACSCAPTSGRVSRVPCTAPYSRYGARVHANNLGHEGQGYNLMSPTAPKKPCPNARCRDLSGDCPLHGRTAQRQAHDQARGSSRARGYANPVWLAIRAAVLERDPLCTWGSLTSDRAPAAYTCGRLSTTAAHLVPREQGGTDAPENLRGLCTSHHSTETSRRESWNRGR